jgi:hypothetical protein
MASRLDILIKSLKFLNQFFDQYIVRPQFILGSLSTLAFLPPFLLHFPTNIE